MISIVDKKQCCGCSACFNICPQQCIRMQEDEEGFLYPQVDQKICIQCGLCEKVCPLLNNNAFVEKDFPREFYAVQALDDVVRAESTSGGAFTPLGQAVLEQRGVVFGAAFQDNKSYHVKHRVAEEPHELRMFRGSKYVQSEMGDSMQRCKAYLEAGRMVLFSGTPCQIAGLKSYLRKDYDNLLTVDVVCRAVPSPKVFQKYLEYQAKHIPGRIENVRFRDKCYGYSYSTMSIYSSSGKKYHKGIESDLYLRTFFSGICDRPSCSTCQFRSYHLSDITLWDCFHVSVIDASMDDNKGTTRLSINTHKGKQLLEQAKKYLKIRRYEPSLDKKEVAYSENRKNQRTEFFHDIDLLDADTFFDKYFPSTIKVKILGIVRYTTYRLGIYRTLKKIWDYFKNH